MRLYLLATLACCATATLAHAEFVVRTAQPAVSAPPPAQVPTPTGANGQPSDPEPSSPAKPAPRFKIAYGFGNDVPLAFACRQIVPRAVHITYGPGADPKASVSWKGGDTWNHVLRDAVSPLGLRLVMTTMAVEIRR